VAPESIIQGRELDALKALAWTEAKKSEAVEAVEVEAVVDGASSLDNRPLRVCNSPSEKGALKASIVPTILVSNHLKPTPRMNPDRRN